LKVQRDAKHYYMIRAQRKVGDKTIYTYLGLNGDIYAYRKISAEEFAKCITLIIGDALNQSGISSGGERNCDGNVGKFRTKHPGATQKLSYGTVDSMPYQHKYYDLPGARKNTFISDFTITIPYTAESTHSANGTKAYYFSPVSISVSHVSGLPSYTGTLTFTAGGRGSGLFGVETIETIWSVSTSTTTVSTSGSLSASNNESNFKAIFPFGLDQDYDKRPKTYDDEKASERETYKNNWWHVQNGDKKDNEFVLEEE
ncbi:MAG: hypothetical protein J5857_09660, partial [Treponema sp.]|nr:hypothetical protein [Treponema sp.]